MPSVIIVSNRLPVSVKKVEGKLEFRASDGGLARGMSFYTKRRDSLWIGWPGIVSEDLTEADKNLITKELLKQRCAPVFLTQKQIDMYYNGFSNSVLWPLLHNLELSEELQERNWKAYRQVNQLFTEAVFALSPRKSTVWVHDYQLMLLPEMLHTERPESNVGFFLHTPFPVSKLAAQIPHIRSIVKGLLGSSLIGLHTTAYATNFLDLCNEIGPGIVSDDQVILADRIVRVTDFPITIDYYQFAETVNSPVVRREVRVLQKKYGRYRIILTVDRLDLTKGFLERLRAYREFLEQSPRLHCKVMMLMLAIPSRTEITAYRELKEQVEATVEQINQQFGTPKWRPIVYMFKSVPFEELLAMYQIADIAFITPLRDGMNLVAKEYVASKQKKNGVLILSHTAGAAKELTNALLVNPRRPKTLVAALTQAIKMRPPELRKRLGTMQEYLSSYTAQDWASSFMSTLQKPVPVPGLPSRTKHLKNGLQHDLRTHLLQAKRPLILLDYDGVLSHFRSDPRTAIPGNKVHKLLEKLSARARNDLVLISGRSREDLEIWFGRLPVGLAAEHGALVRESGHAWHKVASGTASWKKIIIPALEKYAAKTPGSFVEEKECSLVWHYRSASSYYAQKHLVILKRALKPILKTYNLELFTGKNILEIKPFGVNKGSAALKWLKRKPDFIMAIGDDYTDEDMFAVLPDQAYTIKVGPGRTVARYRLHNVDEVMSLLKTLAA